MDGPLKLLPTSNKWLLDRSRNSEMGHFFLTLLDKSRTFRSPSLLTLHFSSRVFDRSQTWNAFDKGRKKNKTMSRVSDSSLFDTAMHHLLHLPETLEKLARPRGHRSRGAGAGAAEDGKDFGGAPVDIIETPKQYTFVFDVPGLSKSDIQVTLEEEKMLVVRSSGKRKRDGEEDEECKYLRLERRGTLRFQRKFRLPDDVDPSAISAKCENGVLTLALGKLPPEPKSTKTVQVAIA